VLPESSPARSLSLVTSDSRWRHHGKTEEEDDADDPELIHRADLTIAPSAR
jgi:hypothetical protein